MMQVIFAAIGAGLLMTIMTGPAFFSLLRTSIEKGFVAGAGFAVGVFTADLIFVSITLLGASLLSDLTEYQNYIAFIGSVFLATIGYKYFSKDENKAEKKSHKEIELTKLKIFGYYFKGFFMNLLNPGMLFYWIGLVSYLGTGGNYSSEEIKLFLFTSMFTVLSTDLIKAYAASKMRHMFSQKVIHYMNKFVGIALMIFALVIVFKILFF